MRLRVGLVGGFIGLFIFVVHPRIGRKNLLIGFLDIVYSSKVPGVGPNEFCWKPTRSRHFEVSNFYLSFYPPTFYFPWRLVWQSKVSPRVAFFSWSTSLGKILTIDNIRKRHIIVLDWCYMCKRCEESVDHLLLYYPNSF